jgi:hypothetical protein
MTEQEVHRLEGLSLVQKIRWRNRHPIRNAWFYADKLVAKRIARWRAPDCRIAQVLLDPASVDLIDVTQLPPDFLFKARHGSGWQVKVEAGRDVATGQPVSNEQLRKLARWWSRRVYRNGAERQYRLISPGAFIEEHLGPIVEYRVFCFAGTPRMIMVDTPTADGVRSVLYDPHWTRIRGFWKDPEGLDLDRPPILEEIVSLASLLSQGIDFVRIDLMSARSGLHFGEFTFTPNAGTGRITPPELDRLAGSWWNTLTPEIERPDFVDAVGWTARISAWGRIASTAPIDWARARGLP